MKFKKVVLEAWKSLQQKGVPVQDVATILEHYLANTYDTSPLQGISDYRALLRFIDEKVSWFNYELFGYVVDDFLKDQCQITALWESYKEDLEQYAKQRIEEYEGVRFGLPASKKHKVLLMPIDPQYKMKLSDISVLRSSICNVLGCPSSLLYFVAVHRSSIILEFLIPLPAYKQLFPLSKEQLRALCKLGILSVNTGDTQVFTNLKSSVMANVNLKQQKDKRWTTPMKTRHTRPSETVAKQVAQQGAKYSTKVVTAAVNPVGKVADLAQTGLEITGHKKAGQAVGVGGNMTIGAIAGGTVGGPPGALIGAAVASGVWVFGEVAGAAVGAATGTALNWLWQDKSSHAAEIASVGDPEACGTSEGNPEARTLQRSPDAAEKASSGDTEAHGVSKGNPEARIH